VLQPTGRVVFATEHADDWLVYFAKFAEGPPAMLTPAQFREKISQAAAAPAAAKPAGP
jgi:hypothetical protein